MAVAEIRHVSSACMHLSPFAKSYVSSSISCARTGFSSRSRRVNIRIRPRLDFMAKAGDQNCHAEADVQTAGKCVTESRMHVEKSRGVTIAARDVPISFAVDMSTGLLSSSSSGSSQDIQHINDSNDNDDDDVVISNSQQPSAVQAPAIATHGSRWNRVGRRVGNGGEGKGFKARRRADLCTEPLHINPRERSRFNKIQQKLGPQ